MVTEKSPDSAVGWARRHKWGAGLLLVLVGSLVAAVIVVSTGSTPNHLQATNRSPTNSLAPIAPGQREVTQPEAGQATTPTKKSDKGSTGSAGAAGGTTRPAGPSKGSAGPGGSAPPASPGNPGTTPATRPPTPPPGGGPSANLGQPKQLTAGGGNYKDATYSSVTTGPISPVAGGRIFVWVIGLIGNDDPAPIPSASGLGLSFTEVATITKKEDAPRRLTVLSAVVGPNAPAPGRLRIDFNGAYPSSRWAWTVMQTKGTVIRQIGTNGVGGFVTSYSVSLPSPSAAGNETLAGFGMGDQGTVRPGSGDQEVGQAEAGNYGRVFSEWTASSAQTLECSWDNPAHSMGIALEVAP